jgi:hypothetical protein
MDEHSRHHGTDTHFIIVWAMRVNAGRIVGGLILPVNSFILFRQGP